VTQGTLLSIGTERSGSPSFVADDVDLAEWYLDQDWSDGVAVVPPTPERSQIW
jgi:hypothetical protein